MNDDSDRSFLCQVAERVQKALTARIPAQGFRPARNLRLRSAQSDGWYTSLGKSEDAKLTFQVWFDRYAGIGERRFWFGISTRKPAHVHHFIAVLSDRLGSIATFSRRDITRLKKSKDWQLSPDLPHNKFNQPVVELYGGGHSFYGFYDVELRKSAERVREMVLRATNFLAEALGAYSTAIGGGSTGGSIERQVVTRLSYNSSNWQRPTGDARKHEASGTYNQEFGFGHEDWLFRSEWQIDGWRYAFLQGVNRHHARLVKECRPITVTLFTIEPDKRRRFVAAIQELEILDDQQAQDAVEAFKERGWYDIMRREILDAGGDDSGFGNPKGASHILNVRFRIDNITPFPPDSFLDPRDPIVRLTRYQIYDYDQFGQRQTSTHRVGRRGDDQPPETKSWMRKGTAPVECTPDHAKMQKNLMKELRKEFPSAVITREMDFVDVRVQTTTEIVLYEIKCDQQPRSVVRHALGQILEYAYHPTRNHQLPVRLCIVGRCEPTEQDRAYLNRLQGEFSLPIEYRVISP